MGAKISILFIANSTKDIYSIRYSDSLAQLLTDKKPAHLTWQYKLCNEEVHESLAYVALYQGLKFYYHNYGSLVCSDINEYNELGGLSYITNYFQKRSERFGFDQKIDNSTKDALIWLAWNRDDFKSFDFFMQQFKDVLLTQRYKSAYWQNRFGQFYLKHLTLDKAKIHFNTGIINYPDADEQAAMHSALAKIHFAQKNISEAIMATNEAIKHAGINSDPLLIQYQQQLINYQKFTP